MALSEVVELGTSLAGAMEMKSDEAPTLGRLMPKNMMLEQYAKAATG